MRKARRAYLEAEASRLNRLELNPRDQSCLSSDVCMYTHAGSAPSHLQQDIQLEENNS